MDKMAWYVNKCKTVSCIRWEQLGQLLLCRDMSFDRFTSALLFETFAGKAAEQRLDLMGTLGVLWVRLPAACFTVKLPAERRFSLT